MNNNDLDDRRRDGGKKQIEVGVKVERGPALYKYSTCPFMSFASRS
jgi:hypothetical protein